MRIPRICIGLAATFSFITAQFAPAQDAKTLPITEQAVVYQMIGEFINSGLSNLQYGYLTSVTGLDNVFSSTTTKDETTALFTFVTNATTVQVVTHGPFRVINRTGTTTIYLNNGPSSFSDPASFAQGTPIQKSSFTQQSIVNTVTNSFVTVHTNTVTGLESFVLDGVTYRLGQLNKSFRTNYSGQQNSPGLVPTGWFAGTSTGSKN
jgi:hypothetical protein